MYLTIISVSWVCYDQSVRENIKFITNFGLSLAQVNWNVVYRFLDLLRAKWFSGIVSKQFPTAPRVPLTKTDYK